MNKYKIICVTNIPTPYRNKLYNLMQEILPKKGIEFDVYYMAKNEPNRKWKVNFNEIKYNYKIFRGLHPTIKNMYAHFNPNLFVALFKNSYDMLIVGGLGSPSHLIVPYLSSKKKILSIESNLDSVKIKKGLGAWVKKKTIKQYHAFQITGTRCIDYLQHFDRENIGPYIVLPNIIDEIKFKEEVAELKKHRDLIRKEYEVHPETQLWICPARLERIKGLHILLPLLKEIGNFKLLIVGEGSEKDNLQKLIDSYNLPVKLLGFKQQKEMLRLYAASDLFVLPSKSDPSPLSPIEAIAGGLPILVSDKIGNYNDVFDGNNGWGINIDSPENTRDIILKITSKSNLDLKELGKNSLTLYDKNFDSYRLIEKYAQDLLKILVKTF